MPGAESIQDLTRGDVTKEAESSENLYPEEHVVSRFFIV
jgi:hypothetical protein